MTGWADEARTRQGLYRFVGAALRPPEAEQLELLGSAWGYLDDRDLDRHSFSIEWRRFGDALAEAPSLEELEIEYVRLFGVGMTGTPAMPTESYYRVPTRDGGIAGFVSSLLREYRSLGVVTTGSSEAPDHISTELNVMSYLCGVEADAWESGKESLARDIFGHERRFLKAHLAVWVPIFAHRARAAGPNDFYRRLIDFTHALVVGEADYVHALVNLSVTS
jgi:TorA maturation chaperone TorD